MATFTWKYYGSTGPAWTSIGANKLVFCSSLTDLATNITVAAFNDGTHIGNGTPGTDQCGTNHANNVKYLTGSTMSVNGAASESINDTNLAVNECTIQVNFSHGSSVVTSGARLYCFDGSTPATLAVNVDMYAFERGVSATAWTKINDDSANTGGDNSGQYLGVADDTTATSHDYSFAVSMSPEDVGALNFALGMALIYS